MPIVDVAMEQGQPASPGGSAARSVKAEFGNDKARKGGVAGALRMLLVFLVTPSPVAPSDAHVSQPLNETPGTRSGQPLSPITARVCPDPPRHTSDTTH